MRPASQVIAAEIQGNMVKPGGELGCWPKFPRVEVRPDESLHGQLQGIGFVVHLTQDEAKQTLLVPVH